MGRPEPGHLGVARFGLLTSAPEAGGSCLEFNSETSSAPGRINSETVQLRDEFNSGTYREVGPQHS